MFDGILGMSPYGDSKSNSIVAALTKEKIIEVLKTDGKF